MEQKYARGQHPNSRGNLLKEPPAGAQSKGGRAAMKAKKKRNDIRKMVEDILTIPMEKGRTKKLRNIMEARTKNLTVIEAMTVAQVRKAISGDTRAFNSLLEAVHREPFQGQGREEETHSTDDVLYEELRKRNLPLQIPEGVTFEGDELENDMENDQDQEQPEDD